MTQKFIPRTIPYLEMLSIAQRGLTTKQIGVIFSMDAGGKLLRLKEQMLVSREKNCENIFEWKLTAVGIKKMLWLRNREKQKISEGKDSS